MTLIYAQAFPWSLSLVSSSELGEGTRFPLKTGLARTHRIFWATARLSLSGVISASQGTESGTVGVTGEGGLRADDPREFIRNPVGGGVGAFGTGLGSGGAPFEADASFAFFANSAAAEHDYLKQHLEMMVSGAISRTDSGLFVPMSFNSVRANDDDAEVGICDFAGFQIRLYATLAPGWFLSVGLAASAIPF